MTFIESLIIACGAVLAGWFIVSLFASDVIAFRERRKRRGQVRRAAKKAGMSFTEYSIRHFSS